MRSKKGRTWGKWAQRIEHVDNAKCQENMGLVGGARNVMVDKVVEKVGDGVKATVNANAELASGKEESSKVRVEVGEKDGSREAAPGSANALPFSGLPVLSDHGPDTTAHLL